MSGFIPEKFTWSADSLINSHVSDPRLRELLAYLNPLYGGVEGHTPAYVHALIHVLYINGATRFKGGSQQLADALKRVIENAGRQCAFKQKRDKNRCLRQDDNSCTHIGRRYIQKQSITSQRFIRSLC